jgi:hypothetical protein
MKSFDFASPSQYGDWAQYAGFNRNTGEIEGMRPVEQGVPPPSNLTDMLNNRLAPVQSVVGAVAPAMAQLATGNFVGAASTVRQAKNPTQQTVPTQQPAPIMGYDYTQGLDL